MATGAQADDLTALKAQLEALQSRVNQLESTGPAASAGAPEGASYISFRRGSDLGWDMSNLIPADERLMDDRGFTVAITPTADLPAPIMEVAISGYVKADFLYDTHSFRGDSGLSPVVIGGGDDENVRLHARQSRFRITSKSDTAVGQIRTLIETDFFGAGNTLRLRHAWGEWDMTPNTTFGAGQFWTNFYAQAGQINTIDFGGLKGGSDGISRQSQFRITHRAGPATISVALEDPTGNSVTPFSAASTTAGDHDLPDLTARAAFSIGSASIQVSGVVLENHLDADGFGVSDSSIGYGLAAGVDIPFGDMITLYGHAAWTDGASRYISSGTGYNAVVGAGGNLRNTEMYGFTVGASFKLSEASTINGAYSTVRVTDNRAAGAIKSEDKIHLNYLWQPVSKLRMGVEASWQEDTYGGGLDDDNLRLQFATWFFF
jgi:hypothetical protein